MNYDEPPYWMVPVRQTLAAFLIDLSQYDNAIAALHASFGNDDRIATCSRVSRGNG